MLCSSSATVTWRCKLSGELGRQPCSVAVVLTAVHCCVINSSAKNSYDFYGSSAIVVYVTLLHNIEIDNISIVGCLRPVWLI